MSSMELTNLSKQNMIKMLSEGKRFDGRGIYDHRTLDISFEVSNMAEGSARVKLGKTEVIVGIKLALGEPYSDSPDKGNLMVTSDLLPIASPRFETGPPGFNAIELGRLIDRSIRESGMIEFSKLCVAKGEKVWTVFIDIYPINDDGNLIDAATIGAATALKSAILPGIDNNGNVDYKNRSKKPVPISKETSPLAFSFFKIGNSLILDPTREEQEAADTRITFGISKWNGQYMMNSGQKMGDSPLSREDIEKISSIMKEKYDYISNKIDKLLK